MTSATNDASAPADGRPLGAIEMTDARFAWSPPLTPLARKARRRVRMTSVPLVILTILWAASSVWTDGLDSIALALVTPLIVIAAAVAVDRLMNVGGRLRLDATPEGLTVKRGRVRQRVPYGEITGVAVRARASEKVGATDSTPWFVVIDRADREAIRAAIPIGSGSAFDRSEAARLEAELRRRWGH